MEALDKQTGELGHLESEPTERLVEHPIQEDWIRLPIMFRIELQVYLMILAIIPEMKSAIMAEQK